MLESVLHSLLVDESPFVADGVAFDAKLLSQVQVGLAIVAHHEGHGVHVNIVLKNRHSVVPILALNKPHTSSLVVPLDHSLETFLGPESRLLIAPSRLLVLSSSSSVKLHDLLLHA